MMMNQHKQTAFTMLPYYLFTLGVLLLYSPVAPAQPTLAMRTQAVKNVAHDNLNCNKEGIDQKKCKAAENKCKNIAFYWEMGNANGVLASGRKGLFAPSRDTVLKIASASKWLFAAYVVQRENGQVTQNEIDGLTLTAAYTDWSQCGLRTTVGGVFPPFE